MTAIEVSSAGKIQSINQFNSLAYSTKRDVTLIHRMLKRPLVHLKAIEMRNGKLKQENNTERCHLENWKIREGLELVVSFGAG